MVITLPNKGNVQLELPNEQPHQPSRQRTITNLRFANDIDGLAGEEEELAKLVERLDKVSTSYGMEIRAEKTKLVIQNTSAINTEIKVIGRKLETVTSFK